MNQKSIFVDELYYFQNVRILKITLFLVLKSYSYNCTYYMHVHYIDVFIIRIGKLICTKAVGLWEQEDITQNYKYPESRLHIFMFIIIL